MKQYYLVIENGQQVVIGPNGEISDYMNGMFAEGAFDQEIKMPTLSTIGKIIITYELKLCSSREEVIQLISHCQPVEKIETSTISCKAY